MLNFFGNTNLVPNGYVYTSRTGSKYVFLEGLWFNNSSMKLVNPATYGNMYQSAQKQIVEHNSKHTIKIGQVYLREGQEHVYIGSGKYTQAGIIVEDSDKSKKFKNFHKADPNDITIPNGFYADEDMYLKDGKWKMRKSNFVQENPKYIKQIEDTAKEKIRKYNSTAKVPINSTLDYKGEKLTWDGSNWLDEEGLAFDGQITRQINKYLDSINYGDEPESTGNEEQPQPESGNDAPPESDKPQDTPKEEEKAGHTQLSGFDGEPVDKVDSTQAEVPDGFVYVSPQQKKYYKKGGTWYSTETKKPINGGSVALINRAAAAQIKHLDSRSPIKIGEEWTSKAGKTYKYVGDDRFISADGKMLPKGMASKAKDYIIANKDDSTEDDIDSDVDNDSSSSNPQGSNDEEKADDTDTNSNDNKDDKVKGLADKIKSNPNARKITVLLTRADKISLMAADILLSGDADKVKQIIQSLNKRDE